MTDFSGKNVLVLGGSRGIGAAIVRRFATDKASVAFTYSSSARSADELATETGAVASRVDSGNREELIAAVSKAGSLDVLVISAGVIEIGDPLALDPDAIERMLRINIHAPYFAAVEAARKMNEGGRILIIGSTNGDRAPFAGVTAYALTKSALQGLARGLARDLGHRNITVNVIQPGATDTDMNPADGPMKDVMHSFIAIKRHARPEEIAGMVAYLAGPEAGYVTGAMHTIDGGFAA